MVIEEATYVYEFREKSLVPELRFKFNTLPNEKGIGAVNGSKDMSVYAGLTEGTGSVKVVHFDRDNKEILI